MDDLDEEATGAGPQQEGEKARVRFCEECNNMLYAREVDDPNDPLKKVLGYVCENENCGMVREHVEASDSVVFKKSMKKAVTKVDDKEAIEKLIHQAYGAAEDIISDATLPRSRDVRCELCGHEEACFFQARGLSEDDSMKLFFVCTRPGCGHQWTY